METTLEDPLRLLGPHLLLPLAVVRAAPETVQISKSEPKKFSFLCMVPLSIGLSQESYYAKTKCCGPAWFQCGSGSRISDEQKLYKIIQLKKFLF